MARTHYFSPHTHIMIQPHKHTQLSASYLGVDCDGTPERLICFTLVFGDLSSSCLDLPVANHGLLRLVRSAIERRGWYPATTSLPSWVGPVLPDPKSHLHHITIATDPSGRANSDPTKGDGGQKQPRLVEKLTEQPTVQNIEADFDGVCKLEWCCWWQWPGQFGHLPPPTSETLRFPALEKRPCFRTHVLIRWDPNSTTIIRSHTKSHTLLRFRIASLNVRSLPFWVCAAWFLFGPDQVAWCM